MRILFLTDNFPPEVNAPATRTFEHCREWVSAGAEVTVITCAPNFPRGEVFPGYENRWIQREVVEGINVVRVWSYMAPNAGFARRVVDYVSFAATAFLAGMREDFDIIVATSPQFFTTWAGALLARIKQRPWVFELRDLWPESIVATGSMKRGFLFNVLERIELGLYRDSAHVVAVTNAFKDDLERRGIREGKISVVTNGVRPAVYRHHLDGGWTAGGHEDFTVGYLGTHGLAHGLEVVLDAAELLSNEPVRFVLVGDGAQKGWLQDQAARRGLGNVEFHPPIPRGEVPGLLTRIDAAVVPLRRTETFRTVIPSKIFEAAAAGRPVLLGVEGEAQGVIDAFGAGLCFEPENAGALADAVRRLASDVRLYEALQSGCSRLAAAYDRDRLAEEMLAILMAVRDDRTRSPARV